MKLLFDISVSRRSLLLHSLLNALCYLLQESGCLLQQMLSCLPQFNCGGCVNREHYSSLKVSNAPRTQQIYSADKPRPNLKELCACM